MHRDGVRGGLAVEVMGLYLCGTHWTLEGQNKDMQGKREWILNKRRSHDSLVRYHSPCFS